VYENITASEVYPYSFLAENCPEDKQHDLDYIMELMDWELNITPDYYSKFFRAPITASQDENHVEKWICYGNDYIAAKELTVFPGKTYVDKEKVAYGCIFIQGNGGFGSFKAETPTMLRFGQISQDEYFVGIQAAEQGVVITNPSKTEPIVILKHFPACHPDTPGVAAE
jgi:hypothetical protein